MRDRAHDDAMAESLLKEPAYAAQLLRSILEDGDEGELLIALQQMAKAFGSASCVTKKNSARSCQSLTRCLRTRRVRLLPMYVHHVRWVLLLAMRPGLTCARRIAGGPSS